MRVFLAPVAIALTSAVLPAAAAVDQPERHVVLVAHRGGLDHGYPENTIAAFRQAILGGAEAIEIDLRATRDGAIVVIHDRTLDRTTNGRGPVAEITFAELRRLDAGGGERIPTFEEVLQLVAGTGVLLVADLKRGAAVDRQEVVRLVSQYGVTDHLILGLRTLEDLTTIRGLNGDLRTLAFIAEVEDIEAFAAAGVDMIRLWPKWIAANPGLVERVHRLGKPVWATTGDAARDELAKLVALGVDGILSDRPEETAALRAELGALQAR